MRALSRVCSLHTGFGKLILVTCRGLFYEGVFEKLSGMREMQKRE